MPRGVRTAMRPAMRAAMSAPFRGGVVRVRSCVTSAVRVTTLRHAHTPAPVASRGLRSALRTMFPTGTAVGFGRGFALKPLSTFPSRHPIIGGALFAGAKTGLVDYMVQRSMEGRSHDEVDWSRVGLFAAFGLTYVAGAGGAHFSAHALTLWLPPPCIPTGTWALCNTASTCPS